MLTVEKLEKNKIIFQETNRKYNIFTKELEDFLGDDFYIAPATTNMDMYGCYPGGLLQHLKTVSKYAVHINNLLPDNIKQDIGTIIRIVFISQIGKVFLFKPNPNDWERTNRGKMYTYTTDLNVSLRIGERSIYYAFNYGVKLTDEEYQAIINLDKDDTDKMAKYFSSPLSQIIKQGFELAILEEKYGKK